jgi:hypothetical protein
MTWALVYVFLGAIKRESVNQTPAIWKFSGNIGRLAKIVRI